MKEEKLPELLDGCLKNNRSSQKLLYQECYNFAMTICLRYASNRYEAAEVLNDGFFKVFTTLGRYDRSRPFQAWLGKIMRNTAIDYYRANLREAAMEELSEAESVNAEASIEHQLGYQDLLAMVQRLSHAYRVVFNLHEIDGYSHEEIAGMLQIKAATSRANLSIAKHKLQHMIKCTTVKQAQIQPITDKIAGKDGK